MRGVQSETQKIRENANVIRGIGVIGEIKKSNISKKILTKNRNFLFGMMAPPTSLCSPKVATSLRAGEVLRAGVDNFCFILAKKSLKKVVRQVLSVLAKKGIISP